MSILNQTTTKLEFYTECALRAHKNLFPSMHNGACRYKDGVKHCPIGLFFDDEMAEQYEDFGVDRFYSRVSHLFPEWLDEKTAIVIQQCHDSLDSDEVWSKAEKAEFLKNLKATLSL